jgi:hypothetical protein
MDYRTAGGAIHSDCRMSPHDIDTVVCSVVIVAVVLSTCIAVVLPEQVVEIQVAP